MIGDAEEESSESSAGVVTVFWDGEEGDFAGKLAMAIGWFQGS